MSKFLSRKLFVAIGTIAALVSAHQYDAALGVAGAYILAQAHVDASKAKSIAAQVQTVVGDVVADAGDPRYT